MAQVSFSDLVDGVIHTAAHHNDRFNALKSRINAIQSDNLEDSSVTGPKIAMGSDAQGDILIRGVTSYQRLAAGTSGQFLKTLGSGANPLWADVLSVAAVVSSSRLKSAGTGAQNVAHGLGKIPKAIIVFGGCDDSAGTASIFSWGFATGTAAGSQMCITRNGGGTASDYQIITSGQVARTSDNNPYIYNISVTALDATNIEFTWTSDGNSNGNTHDLLVLAIG